MKVSGTATINAPRDKVFAALNDPGVLVRTIPGCQQLDALSESSYRMTITAGVASIKGTYEGQVELIDVSPPDSFILKASGSGAPGTLSTDVKVRLADHGKGLTRLDYDADATVGGMIGGVGQRVLTGAAKKTAADFFRNIDDLLTGKAPATEPTEAGRSQAAAQERPTTTYARDVGRSHEYRTRDLLLAALAGAAVALAGVALGWARFNVGSDRCRSLSTYYPPVRPNEGMR
jgi:hypothetical protein